jgi:sugar phosphate isomerase/epimerase
MLRRTFLLGSGAALVRAASTPLAICSETFAGMSFAEACKAARRTGYDGIEIEPAHLDSDPAAISTGRRQEIRRMIEGEGLRCPGLHSFLKSPPGLHLTTGDAALRARSWEYFARLVDLAADLAPAPVMVLGSAKQREAAAGSSPRDAALRLVDGLGGLATAAEKRSVRILLEPLAPHLCNVVNTLAEAVAIVRSVASPAVQTIFDTHNTAGESESAPALLKRYLPFIRHVHLNELDGRRPGAGHYPFGIVLNCLREVDYRDWISVEVFDFKPDGETVARLSREYLRRVAENNVGTNVNRAAAGSS